MSDVESNEEDVMQEGTRLGDDEDFDNAIDQVESAADAAFNEALDNGATPEEAFDAACVAAEEVAAEAGIPPEEVQTRIEAAKEAFDQGLEEGKDPDECFDQAGDAAGFNAADQVEDAADAAFNEALDNGASPEEAFDAACVAAEEAAAEAGIAPEEVQARTDAAKEAFDQALEEGKDPEECFDEASDAAGFNEGEQPPLPDDEGFGNAIDQ
ncbi:hypothetical protein OAL10_08355, partial [Gammaproteobacteria bacterium]|nr:hypothetical protein [Gammaproteobacteria bacterium]